MQVQNLPAVEGRVETGPVQFGDDWPGVFIRGDHALVVLAPQLRQAEKLLQQIDTKADPAHAMTPFTRGVLIGLASLLEQCDATKERPI